MSVHQCCVLCGGIFTSPARTRLRHRSKQRQSSTAETEESATEDENNVTSNVTSDADTEAEPQGDLCRKGGNRNSIVWLWFGFKKSATDQTTVICKTCRQQVVTSDSNTSDLFYHLMTRRHIYRYEDIKLAISWYNILSISHSTTPTSIPYHTHTYCIINPLFIYFYLSSPLHTAHTVWFYCVLSELPLNSRLTFGESSTVSPSQSPTARFSDSTAASRGLCLLSSALPSSSS